MESVNTALKESMSSSECGSDNDVVINPSKEEFYRHEQKTAVLDVEDDEKDGFVGIGICFDDLRGFYFSDIPEWLHEFISRGHFVGHNFKSDLHKLRKWGIDVTSEQIQDDTMLMSYVQKSTRESQGLKELCAELLGIQSPTYADVVGKGVRKITLDKQDVDVVARYNVRSDLIPNFKLWKYFKTVLTPAEKQYYETIELPITRLLFDMEERGVLVDVEYLRSLDDYFSSEINRCGSTLHKYSHRRRVSGPKGVVREELINLNSTQQVRDLLLRPNNINVEDTNKATLRPFEATPLVQLLCKHREYSKLRNTYTSSLLASPDLPRIHTTFNQCSFQGEGHGWRGIRTGRLSSSSPNLQNIPTRTEIGNSLRRAFVARRDCLLVVADYSQIEWRLAAHFSKDQKMAEYLNQKKDIYQVIADRAGQSRKKTKTAVLAANYMAGGNKIAEILNIPVNEGYDILNAYKDEFPVYFEWMRNTINDGNDYVDTILGRRTYPEKSSNKVPYKIQGSAADIIKKAMLECDKGGIVIQLTVHDELHTEVERKDLKRTVEDMKFVLENVVKLDIPLEVEIGWGKNWAEAK